ncbi:MAG: methyltransferase family protein [Chloroflexota bacterium]
MTVLKSLLFLIFVPGFLLGYIPFSISLTDTPLFDPGPLRYFAFLLWPLGAAAMLWCFRDFTFRGRGTPAPIDPPKELVISGPYRYVRNPMYASGILFLLGWLVWSPSPALIVAPFLFFAATHLFVTTYEEPTLKKKFGAAYEAYLQKVPRWIPRFRFQETR